MSSTGHFTFNLLSVGCNCPKCLQEFRSPACTQLSCQDMDKIQIRKSWMVSQLAFQQSWATSFRGRHLGTA